MEMKFFIFLLFGGFMVTTLTQRQQTQFNSEYRKDLPQNFSLGSHSAEVTPVQLEEAESIPDLQTTYMLTEKNSEFGFNLYRKIANLHEDNVFFSPNSISTTFAMLSLGAKGETRNNILQGLNIVNFANSSNKYQLHRLFQWLHSNITSNKDLLISQGNSLFIQNDLELKQTFINDLSHFYNADITPVNFQDTVNTKDIINQYIRNRTSGKINELLDSVDAGARLMFINYNLFKGKWKSPFDPNLTVDGIFYVNAYTRVKVPMMYKEGSFLLTYDNNHSCTVLKLPYKGSASMLVVMPTDAGYQLLEDELSAELIGQWIEALRVIHKAVINVDEKGTEAAAVTGTFALPYSLPPVIKIDHPFLFMIHEDITKTLLFIGRVKDPTKL